MNHRVDAPEQAIDFNNENSNTSANPTFDAVLGARLSRRGLLRGSVGTVGTAVLGGMVSATVLGIFFVPVFFVLIRGYFAERKAKQTASETGAAA